MALFRMSAQPTPVLPHHTSHGVSEAGAEVTDRQSDSDDTFFVPRSFRRQASEAKYCSDVSKISLAPCSRPPNMVLISTTSRYRGDEFCDISLDNGNNFMDNNNSEGKENLKDFAKVIKARGTREKLHVDATKSHLAYDPASEQVVLPPFEGCGHEDGEGNELHYLLKHSDKGCHTQGEPLPFDYSVYKALRTSFIARNNKSTQSQDAEDTSVLRLKRQIDALPYGWSFEDSDSNANSENSCFSVGRRASRVDDLLLSIYRNSRRSESIGESDTLTEHSTTSDTPLVLHRTRSRSLGCCSSSGVVHRRSRLINKDVTELRPLVQSLQSSLSNQCALLIRELKRRDRLRHRRDQQNDHITAILHALSQKRSQDTRMRFSVAPMPGDSGFMQWHDAMMMCARLPGGIPQEFRRRLWLTLSEKHLQARGVDWAHAERFCFNEWSNPDDDELGDQIVKDLHRTGCSLFCGEDAEDNQAMLKRVLLAYARWNKAVGYCQGFNMLAAIILEVMERQESDALKVMIYLIEGVLPESYFANNLRGLSVDMAVFRDLLRLRLPHLSRHLEHLQHDAADLATGTSYEPPLTNVFTMQWFLTLFSNCLPRDTVMRVWDLTFLHGNEVLLRTALAIWDGLAVRILEVHSADEFYTVMGMLTQEMLTYGHMDANKLVQTVVTLAPFPFPGLAELRDKYTYNITPWTQSVSSVARKGLKLFYSDDDDDENDEADQQIAVAAAFGISSIFRKGMESRGPSPVPGGSAVSPGTFSPLVFPAPRHSHEISRPNLDISALKKQYARLRERQKQAHIILTAQNRVGSSHSGDGGRSGVTVRSTPLTMNHLLRGKKALTSKTKRMVPHGVIPTMEPKKKVERKLSDSTGTRSSQSRKPAAKSQGPAVRQYQTLKRPPSNASQGPPKVETLHWKDTPRRDRRASLPSGVKLLEPTATGVLGVQDEADDDDEGGSSTSTELCDDEEDKMSDLEADGSTEARPATTSPRLETVTEHEMEPTSKKQQEKKPSQVLVQDHAEKMVAVRTGVDEEDGKEKTELTQQTLEVEAAMKTVVSSDVMSKSDAEIAPKEKLEAPEGKVGDVETETQDKSRVKEAAVDGDMPKVREKETLQKEHSEEPQTVLKGLQEEHDEEKAEGVQEAVEIQLERKSEDIAKEIPNVSQEIGPNEKLSTKEDKESELPVLTVQKGKLAITGTHETNQGIEPAITKCEEEKLEIDAKSNLAMPQSQVIKMDSLIEKETKDVSRGMEMKDENCVMLKETESYKESASELEEKVVKKSEETKLGELIEDIKVQSKVNVNLDEPSSYAEICESERDAKKLDHSELNVAESLLETNLGDIKEVKGDTKSEENVSRKEFQLELQGKKEIGTQFKESEEKSVQVHIQEIEQEHKKNSLDTLPKPTYREQATNTETPQDEIKAESTQKKVVLDTARAEINPTDTARSKQEETLKIPPVNESDLGTAEKLEENGLAVDTSQDIIKSIPAQEDNPPEGTLLHTTLTLNDRLSPLLSADDELTGSTAESSLPNVQPQEEYTFSYGIPLEILLAGKNLTAAEIIARIPFPSDVSFMKGPEEIDKFSSQHNVTPQRSPIETTFPDFPSLIPVSETSLLAKTSPDSSPSKSPSLSPSISPRTSPIGASPRRSAKLTGISSSAIAREGKESADWAFTEPSTPPESGLNSPLIPPKSPKITIEDEKRNIFEIHTGVTGFSTSFLFHPSEVLNDNQADRDKDTSKSKLSVAFEAEEILQTEQNEGTTSVEILKEAPTHSDPVSNIETFLKADLRDNGNEPSTETKDTSNKMGKLFNINFPELSESRFESLSEELDEIEIEGSGENKRSFVTSEETDIDVQSKVLDFRKIISSKSRFSTIFAASDSENTFETEKGSLDSDKASKLECEATDADLISSSTEDKIHSHITTTVSESVPETTSYNTSKSQTEAAEKYFQTSEENLGRNELPEQLSCKENLSDNLNTSLALSLGFKGLTTDRVASISDESRNVHQVLLPSEKSPAAGIDEDPPQLQRPNDEITAEPQTLGNTSPITGQATTKSLPSEFTIRDEDVSGPHTATGAAVMDTSTSVQKNVSKVPPKITLEERISALLPPETLANWSAKYESDMSALLGEEMCDILNQEYVETSSELPKYRPGMEADEPLVDSPERLLTINQISDTTSAKYEVEEDKCKEKIDHSDGSQTQKNEELPSSHLHAAVLQGNKEFTHDDKASKDEVHVLTKDNENTEIQTNQPPRCEKMLSERYSQNEVEVAFHKELQEKDLMPERESQEETPALTTRKEMCMVEKSELSTEAVEEMKEEKSFLEGTDEEIVCLDFVERSLSPLRRQRGESSLTASLEGRISALACSDEATEESALSLQEAEESDNVFESGEPDTETDFFSEKDLSSEAIRQRLWRGVKSLSLDADIALDPDIFCFLIQQSSKSHAKGGRKKGLWRRRNSEVALQELVKENTEIIERIMKQKSVEDAGAFIYSIKETDTPANTPLEEHKSYVVPSKSHATSDPLTKAKAETGFSSTDSDVDATLSKKLPEASSCHSRDKALSEAVEMLKTSMIPLPSKEGVSDPQMPSSVLKQSTQRSESERTPKITGTLKPSSKSSKLSRSSSVSLEGQVRPITFNPFPTRNVPRPPKEVALKLGLYSPTKSPGSSPT